MKQIVSIAVAFEDEVCRSSIGIIAVECIIEIVDIADVAFDLCANLKDNQ